jgi:hypothetical protein
MLRVPRVSAERRKERIGRRRLELEELGWRDHRRRSQLDKSYHGPCREMWIRSIAETTCRTCGKPRRDHGATRGTRRREGRDSKLLRRQLDALGHVNTHLIMRTLCRGACQQCVRYYGTGRIVAAAFAPPMPSSYRAISVPLFHVCLLRTTRKGSDRCDFRDRSLLFFFCPREFELVGARWLPRC